MKKLIFVLALVTVLAFAGQPVLTYAFETLLTSPVNGPANSPSVTVKFGIGTTTPFASLSILGKHFDTDVTSPYVVVASSTPTATTTVFQIGRSGQITQGGRVPTIATSTGSGTGSVPVTVSGVANFVNLNITTGSAPAQNATIATVTLPEACPAATVPVLSPANTKAAATSTAGVYASSTGATTFVVNSGGTSLTASANYIFNVHVGCY